MRNKSNHRLVWVVLIVGLYCLSADAASSRRKEIRKATRANRPTRQSRSTSQAPPKSSKQRSVSRPAPKTQNRSRPQSHNRPVNKPPVQQRTVRPPQQTEPRHSSPRKQRSHRNSSIKNKPLQRFQSHRNTLGRNQTQRSRKNPSKGIKYIIPRRINRYVGNGSQTNRTQAQRPSQSTKVSPKSSTQSSQGNTTRIYTESSPRQTTIFNRKQIIRGNRYSGSTQIRRVHRFPSLRSTISREEGGIEKPQRQTPRITSERPHSARHRHQRHNQNKTIIRRNHTRDFVMDRHRREREIHHHRCRSRKMHVYYIDRPFISKSHRHIYPVVGRHGRCYHHIVRPCSLFNVSYRRGGLKVCASFRPYYHRKYVFVSLGGHHISPCPRIRYYWYGWHPFDWYGYRPLAYRTGGDTYNYYTYNYGDNDILTSQGYGYYDNSANSGSFSGYHIGSSEYMDLIDNQVLSGSDTLTPPKPGPADMQFELGVKAFDQNDYAGAMDHFQQACQYAPKDNMLSLAYAQALFAAKRYTKAAQVLRDTLTRMNLLEEGLFYPRGLYNHDEILLQQIDTLMEQADLMSYNMDLQLLLGYQLLGIGEINQARTPLNKAGNDYVNEKGAKKLLSLLEFIEKQLEQSKKE